MPLNVKENSMKNFEPVPQGIHAAVCNMVVDCGIQSGGKFKPRHQVYIRWEIPAERIEWTDKNGEKHEGPMSIGKFYTASLSEKATLRRDLENWRGKSFTKEELAGFDLFKVLGVPCQIMVSHNVQGQDIYANVTGVMGFPAGVPKPQAENPLIRYSPDDSDHFDALPAWLRDKVASSLSAPETTTEPVLTPPDFDDDIPF